MKSFMYHYVRCGSADLPWFRYLHVQDFKKQLDVFQGVYDFVSVERFMEAFQKGQSIPNSAVLTFDDGLKDHYAVAQELQRRGLWGVFYIPTGPYATGKLLDVHRVHMLIGKYGGQKILDALNDLVSEDMVLDEHMSQFQEVTYTRQDNDAATKQVKQLLNYFISYDRKQLVLDKLMENFFPNEEALCAEYYISEGEMEEMRDMGMVLGGHSVSHPVFSRLAFKEQEAEIVGCFSYLESVLGSLPVKTFCYPYGGDHSFNADTVRGLEREGVAFSFSVQQQDISDCDLVERPQALPRYDCNQFPHGQASMGLSDFYEEQ